MIVLLLTLGCIIHEHIVKEELLAGGTRIYVDEDVVRCCQFGVDVVVECDVQEKVVLDDNVVTSQ